MRLPAEVIAVRNNVTWHLNLDEGIDLALYLGVFEPTTTRTYRKLLKEGDTVIDVGANIGAHALPAATIVGSTGTVVAVEPTQYAFNKMLRNIELNPDIAEAILPKQMFASAPAKSVVPDTLFSSWKLSSNTDIHHEHGGTAKETKGATASTLDTLATDLDLNEVTLIKIDVDGFEYDVLTGAAGTIEKYRPAIIIEIAPYVLKPNNVTPAELVDLLKSFGYRLLFEHNHDEISEPLKYFESLPDGSGINILAVPI
ncbi:FkbM family methyltransferase [Pseudomonadota bacterium]